ncbi:focadhesin-like isoform X2 [Mytilus trossulus]|uniref:focadhesin-like isoform X1 n=1 Tax=Mytilus trossulus TaxID=6551 RepID=UPI0030060841
MEELKRRLEFNNISVQIQAIRKLKLDITKKKEKYGTIIESTPQVDELTILLEKCTDKNNILAVTCCNVIVDLVQLGVIEYDFVMRCLLNLVPSAKNLNGIIQSITALLKLQLAVAINTEQNSLFVSPYTLRLPPHPFITILNNRSESWPQILQEFSHLCHSENLSLRTSCISLMEPFLKFVLLEPQQSLQFLSMRVNLQQTLLQVTSEDSVLKFLVKILPCFQVNTPDSLTMTSQFLSELLPIIKSRQELSILVRFGFSLCLQSTQLQINYSILARSLQNCIMNSKSNIMSDTNLVAIATILSTSPKEYIGPIVNIANWVLKDSSWNPVVVGMLALPTLVLVTIPSVTKTGNKTAQQLEQGIRSLLSTVKKILIEKESKKNKQDNSEFELTMTSEGYQCQEMSVIADQIWEDIRFAEIWLLNLKSCIPKMKTVPVNITNMVASLFLISKTEVLSDLGIQTLVEIAKQDVCQAPNFLPLMLCKLGMETNWDVKLKILKSLPAIARHKVCVGPVMKTIQSLGTTPALRPLSLSLMVDLWQLQDRCFPHLLQMISDYSNGSYDLQLARAKALLEVCKTRPEQHGTDMLGPLSDILNTFSKEEEGPIAAMALEGLYYLCEADVIDIKSAWDVLSVKLSTDTRPVVVEKICDLFSLVPDHAVDTPEYQKFVFDTVRNLWLLSTSLYDNVSQAAFQALSMFPADLFKMSHLPQTLIEDFADQAKLISAQGETTLSVDDVWPNIPALLYVRLLKHIRKGSHKGYEAFLTSMVAKEVEKLPRGIYHSSLRRQGAASNQGKAVGSIPSFLLSQYQKTKQPGLRPGLAAGLLFSYDPPVEVGRDGRPRRHYIMSHSKSFQQMFTTLMHEVPIQPSEWHRTLVIPQGWTSFMDRLFTAMLEGRTAEIELQLKREHTTEHEAEEKQLAAWLWVRGEITGMIKTASRGNPGIQSNSIYALAGLAVTINRYGSNLDKESLEVAEESTEYLSHSHWLTVVMDTIMCLADVNHKPKGSLLGLCQQRSSGDKLPASTLAQATSSVALSQIVPILISNDSSRILPCIRLLLSRLPGSKEESPVLQFHAGLGLGMFLARIFEEHFSDVCGSQGMVEIWKTLDSFEECCFSTKDNRQGCLLGLAMAISAMCEEGKTEARAHVSSVFDKLSRQLEASKEKDTAYQALSVCLACVSGAAFSSNIVSPDQVNKVIDSFVKVNTDNPQITGVSLALGMLCYSISKTGHPTIGEVKIKLYGKWMAMLKKMEEDSMVTLACLNGLISLVGSERTLIPVQSNTSMLGGDVNVDVIIKHAMDTVLKGDNFGIQSNCSWMLGHLYLSACAVAETRASVPPNYSYLPEHSFVRALTDCLLEAAKVGPESIPPELVQITLTSIQEEVTRVLPPVNWAGILTPLMRINFGDEIQKLCLQLAVNQSIASPTAVMFLSSWMTAPLFNTLSINCKQTLYKALPVLIKSVAPSVIKTFLERGGVDILSSADLQDKQEVLKGLHKSLQVPDPPDSITSVLYQCLESLYKLDIKEPSLMCIFGECFTEVPDQIFDKITSDDFTTEDSCYKGMFIRCYLVSKGKQPMATLNSCIDKAINSSSLDPGDVTRLLQCTLYQVLHCQSDYTGTIQCVQWFLELLGHTRNISNGVMEISKDVEMAQVLDFCCNIVSSALCLWTSTIAVPFLMINNNYFSPDVEQGFNKGSLLHPGLSCLPSCIENVQNNPWDQLSPNVIDWIGIMASSSVIPDKTRNMVKASGMMQRHIKDFHKAAVWTKFVHDNI